MKIYNLFILILHMRLCFVKRHYFFFAGIADQCVPFSLHCILIYGIVF